MIGYGNSMFLATHGILARSASGAAVDPDAQAFITAAAITDPTQQAAINTLVTDLKGYNVWSKMQALYPMVGGTNAKHTWNLKNTAQFQISWQGGVTSSVNGVQFNGMNAYGILGYNPSISATLNSHHLSFYSRTQSNGTEVEFGSIDGVNNGSLIEIRTSGITYLRVNNAGGTISFSDSDSRAFYLANRTASNVINGWRNSTKAVTGTLASSVLGLREYYLGAFNNGAASNYTTKQCAFASIGDGLTDTEAANFYTAVQTFQTTLGRSIGTQTVSDTDAQAFVTNAGIVDQVEANAVNNLVIGMKADGTWSKMKAVYPMVGGSSSTMKWNLKDPRDLDIAFRLLFIGGGNWGANGYTPNGSNGYADTKLIPSTALTTSSAHFSKYNRTNDLVGSKLDGVYSLTNNSFFQHNYTGANALIGEIGALITYTQTDSRGLFTVTRTATNVSKLFKNTTQQGSTNTSTITNIPSIVSAYIGARNGSGTAEFYNTYQCAFASIGDGLSDIDVTNLNSRVTTFQTALNRNV